MSRKQIRLSIVSIVAAVLAPVLTPVLLPASAAAQQTPTTLPEAPLPAQHSSLSGTIADIDGGVITGATLTLTSSGFKPQPAANSQPAPLQTRTDQFGRFTFPDVIPGDLKLAIAAPGFASSVQLLTLQPGQQQELPEIQLLVATSTEVQVTLAPHEIAQMEMHEEEKQRLLGVLPNFFVTYDWHAAPLDARQKFELAWKSTIDPTTFLVAGAIAGIQQSQNDFSGYGQGASGYGKRYGAALADDAIGNMLGGAVLPSLLHQDPRYFYKGTGSIPRRAAYAIAAAVICRGDNGRWQPNYSSVLGDFAAGGLSNLYYPASDRTGAGLTIENGFLGVAGDAINNLIEEFVFRKITTHTRHTPPTTTTP